MIGYLRGNLLEKRPPFLLLEVHGVGYELEAPMTTCYHLPDAAAEVALYVHLLVREDAQLLFGFSDQAQRELFRSLLKVNGVGARVALAILSTLSSEELLDCVQRADTATLVRVPGIGRKTAERLIIDLRDRLEQVSKLAPAAVAAHAADPLQDALSALVALGYKANEAQRAVHAVKAQGGARDDLIRNALQYLTQ